MLERIEINPRVCGGSPVIRGTRIPVVVILDHLAAEISWDGIIKEFPALTKEDIAAAIAYARQKIQRPDIKI